MTNYITHLRRLGRDSTADGFKSTLNAFMRYSKNMNVTLDRFDAELMELFEAYLRREGVVKNTSSFYLRNMRRVYNMAVEKGLTVQRRPFAHVYTGIDKTVKRAITLDQIRRLKNLDLSHNAQHAFARDMFMFSFYTRGMSFVDMALLTAANLRGDYLIYYRRKTGQQITVRWEHEMQAIVDRYALHRRTTPPYYLQPIITDQREARHQYQVVQHRVNYHLKGLTEQLKLPHPLTMYVARHSWATIARNKSIPTSVISEALGHDSEKTTLIYLASIDTNQVDRANKKILRLV